MHEVFINASMSSKSIDFRPNLTGTQKFFRRMPSKKTHRIFKHDFRWNMKEKNQAASKNQFCRSSEALSLIL